jgi:hypothetical protein
MRVNRLVEIPPMRPIRAEPNEDYRVRSADNRHQPSFTVKAMETAIQL